MLLTVIVGGALAALFAQVSDGAAPVFCCELPVQSKLLEALQTRGALRQVLCGLCQLDRSGRAELRASSRRASAPSRPRTCREARDCKTARTRSDRYRWRAGIR